MCEFSRKDLFVGQTNTQILYLPFCVLWSSFLHYVGSQFCFRFCLGHSWSDIYIYLRHSKECLNYVLICRNRCLHRLQRTVHASHQHELSAHKKINENTSKYYPDQYFQGKNKQGKTFIILLFLRWEIKWRETN